MDGARDVVDAVIDARDVQDFESEVVVDINEEETLILKSNKRFAIYNDGIEVANLIDHEDIAGLKEKGYFGPSFLKDFHHVTSW